MKALVVIIAALILVAPQDMTSAQTGDTTLDVTVANITVVRGVVHINLCRQAEFLTPNCFRSAQRTVHSTRPMIVRFRDVPRGSYAVQVIHDVDGNGRFDRNRYGAPAEPNGLSRNCMRPRQLPAFSQCAFQLSAQRARITVELS